MRVLKRIYRLISSCMICIPATDPYIYFRDEIMDFLPMIATLKNEKNLFANSTRITVILAL